MEKKVGLARLAERFRESVLWTHVIAIVLEWLGWHGLVLSVAVSVAGAVGSVMQGIPLSLSLMAGFCVFVAAIYLFQVPSFVRAVREVRPQERPDPDIWRHVEQMSLAQAACLLANITPHGTNVVPPGDADGWYRALKGAVSSEEIPRIPMVWDHQNTTGGMYYPDAETVISRDSLRQFIKKRGVSRSVFSD